MRTWGSMASQVRNEVRGDLPWGDHQVCIQATDGTYGALGHRWDHLSYTVACTPFRVDPPPAHLETAYLYDDSTGALIPNTADANFNNNTNRRLVTATWDPNTAAWTAAAPSELPAGALMPAIAFDRLNQPVIAYSLYLTDTGGTPTGLGTNNRLGYATLRSGTWQTRIVEDLLGVERPRLLSLPALYMPVVVKQRSLTPYQHPGGAPYLPVASSQPAAGW